MQEDKANIRAQLERIILPLQGYKPSLHNNAVDAALGPIRGAFPGAVFPLGAVHEFICEGEEGAAATVGFVSGLTATITRNSGAVLWIGKSSSVFAPSLNSFGLLPQKVIFVDLQTEKDVLWVVEEALKCSSLAAVIGEITTLGFTVSRRLQLAVEKSKVTAFLFRHRLRSLDTTASLTRWKITPIQSKLSNDLPGVGLPRWRVDLLRVRNGRVGSWQVEWTEEGLRFLQPLAIPMVERQKKAS